MTNPHPPASESSPSASSSAVPQQEKETRPAPPTETPDLSTRSEELAEPCLADEEKLKNGPSPLPRPQIKSIAPVLTVRAPSPETMWTELTIAINYLTRLDFKMPDDLKPRMIRKSMAWFPLVGAAIGLFGASIDWIMSEIGLPGIVTATFAVIGILWATRALHEEEFASLANQYGQLFNKEEKIGWLKEERSIRYGTLAIIFAIIMKIGAIASLGSSELVFQALVVAGAWSRVMMVISAGWLRPISGDPVADHFQQPPALRVLVALVLGGVLAYIGLDSYAPMAMGVGGIAGLIIALLGANHLRGYNGPLLGAIQQITELSILALILAIQSID